VSFAACALILSAFTFILINLPGNLLKEGEMPRTLTTIFARLGMVDKFTVHPICHICHCIFPPNASPDTRCSQCDNDIYRPRRNIFRRLFFTGSDDSSADCAANDHGSPHVVAPIQLLSDGLRSLFSRPGMVDAVNSWKSHGQVPGELKRMQDGRVWEELKGQDGKSFFYGRHTDKEIRLGVTFSLDWYV
jgi:hypothetical protein